MIYQTKHHIQINIDHAKKVIEGGCSLVYHLPPYAAKIYKSSNTALHLSPILYKKLKKLPLKASNIPISFLYHNGHKEGYLMNWIYQKEQSLIYMDKNQFLSHYSTLEEDAILLGQNGILLQDLKRENLLFGDKILWNDFDLAQITTQKPKITARQNQMLLNYLFYEMIKEDLIFSLKRNKDTSTISFQKIGSNLKKLFTTRNFSDTQTKHFEKKLKKHSNLASYFLSS